jgi:hypothetical protein
VKNIARQPARSSSYMWPNASSITHNIDSVCLVALAKLARLRLSPTVSSEPFRTLYIEKISFSIAPAAFSKWSSKIENATGFLYKEILSLLLYFFFTF